MHIYIYIRRYTHKHLQTQKHVCTFIYIYATNLLQNILQVNLTSLVLVMTPNVRSLCMPAVSEADIFEPSGNNHFILPARCKHLKQEPRPLAETPRGSKHQMLEVSGPKSIAFGRLWSQQPQQYCVLGSSEQLGAPLLLSHSKDLWTRDAGAKHQEQAPMTRAWSIYKQRITSPCICRRNSTIHGNTL